MMKPDDSPTRIASCEILLYSCLYKKFIFRGIYVLITRYSKLPIREIGRGDLLSLSLRQWIPPFLMIAGRRVGEKAPLGRLIFSGSSGHALSGFALRLKPVYSSVEAVNGLSGIA